MTKSFTAARAYDHKTFGRIGTAEFVIESKADVTFTLNGKELPASSIDHLMTFALQSLQDAYAGAENEKDAIDRFEGKLTRILEGTLGTRSGGSGVDPIVAEVRNIIRADVKKAVGDDWKTMEEDARNAAIDQVFESQSEEVQETLREAAKGEIARKAAEKAAKAALGAKLTIILK